MHFPKGDNSNVRSKAVYRWPWPVYVALALFGGYMLYLSLPSDDRYSTPADRLGGLLMAAGILFYAAWRLVKQSLGGPNIETVAAYNSRVTAARQSWIARTLNGGAEKLLRRLLGPPEAVGRRIATVVLPLVLGVIVIQGVALSDHGRDMTQLNPDRISYLTVEDVKRLPTLSLGSYWSFQKVKTISPAVALALKDRTANLGLFLNGLEKLSDEALRHLAHRHGSLHLDGLRSVNDKQAVILALHDRDALSLNGVTTLSDVAAQHLAHLGSRLRLGGLEEISDAGLLVLRRAGVQLPDTLSFTTQRNPARRSEIELNHTP